VGALCELYEDLKRAVGCSLQDPIKYDLQPKAPIPQIALRCVRAIRLIEDRVTSVIVLLDREDRPECCGALATAIGSRVRPDVSCGVEVVIKNRTFENWLVSDLTALRALSGRFSVAQATVARVEPDKADHVDGARVLSGAALSAYEKVADSRRILSKADVLRMGAHSRSFRRFLRVLGHPTYLVQSRLPAKPLGRTRARGRGRK
jgi:hypothetical protein